VRPPVSDVSVKLCRLSKMPGIAAFEKGLARSLPVHTVSPGEPTPDLPEFITDLLTAQTGTTHPST
jgi:hypothetical protein